MNNFIVYYIIFLSVALLMTYISYVYRYVQGERLDQTDYTLLTIICFVFPPAVIFFISMRVFWTVIGELMWIYFKYILWVVLKYPIYAHKLFINEARRYYQNQKTKKYQNKLFSYKAGQEHPKYYIIDTDLMFKETIISYLGDMGTIVSTTPSVHSQMVVYEIDRK
jgi:hypothetical protein